MDSFELNKLLKRKVIDIPEEDKMYEYIKKLLLNFLFPDTWEDRQMTISSPFLATEVAREIYPKIDINGEYSGN